MATCCTWVADCAMVPECHWLFEDGQYSYGTSLSQLKDMQPSLLYLDMSYNLDLTRLGRELLSIDTPHNDCWNNDYTKGSVSKWLEWHIFSLDSSTWPWTCNLKHATRMRMTNANYEFLFAAFLLALEGHELSFMPCRQRVRTPSHPVQGACSLFKHTHVHVTMHSIYTTLC